VLSDEGGRSILMLKQALELAGDHVVVPILVPSAAVGKALSNIAWGLLYEYEDGPARHKRLRFISSGTVTHLAGFPETPVLADHTWYESIAWVQDALDRLRKTAGL